MASKEAALAYRPAFGRSLPVYPAALFLSMFFIPLKGFHFLVAGQSVYPSYFAIVLVMAFSLKPFFEIYLTHFLKPTLVLLAFTIFYSLRASLDFSAFIFFFKVVVALAMAAAYVCLLRFNEQKAMTYLAWAVAITVVFMIYQIISLTFFGAMLPLTAIREFEIGRGLSTRFGLNRATGFTEEPSFVAVMLIGSFFLLNSYEQRSGISQKRMKSLTVLGMLLCTSDNLFATVPLLLLFSALYRLRLTWLFFVLFYAANLVVYPIVLNLDSSFFARFSSYSLFAAEPLTTKFLGIGFNQYSKLDMIQYITPEGIPDLVVDSLGSLWGGTLLEGGILFTICFCLYLTRLMNTAKFGTAYALMAILIMLANYYSPWWPITSFALAYVLHSRTPFVAQDRKAAAGS